MKIGLLLILCFVGQVFALANPSPKTSPERNFEAFWQLFNQYYAHFETRQVDWLQQYQRFRGQVTPTTTDAQLLAIFNAMVAPLKDGHVGYFANWRFTSQCPICPLLPRVSH